MAISLFGISVFDWTGSNSIVFQVRNWKTPQNEMDFPGKLERGKEFPEKVIEKWELAQFHFHVNWPPRADQPHCPFHFPNEYLHFFFFCWRNCNLSFSLNHPIVFTSFLKVFFKNFFLMHCSLKSKVFFFFSFFLGLGSEDSIIKN